MLNRRRFFAQSAVGLASATLPITLLAQEPKKDKPPAGPFTLPKLPYAFDALEPHIDAATMEIHHDKHHATYVSNLNAAVADLPELAGKSVEAIISMLDKVPEKARMKIRNNGGGHHNHTLFWQMMAKDGGKPSDALSKAITESFKSYDAFAAAFKKAALDRFGSGWAWLSFNKGHLEIISSPNQDNPLMDGTGMPILGIDVWEHAYYLKYQNKRAEYIDHFMKVINWEYVSTLFAAVTKG